MLKLSFLFTPESKHILCEPVGKKLKCVAQLKTIYLNGMKRVEDQAEMGLRASMPNPITLPTSTSSVDGGSGTSGEAGASTWVMMPP